MLIVKKICFKPNEVEINYTLGGHFCDPVGNVKYGGSYMIKHMDWLGLPFKLNKNKVRYERSEKMRKLGMYTHYKENDKEIISIFNKNKDKKEDVSKLCECFL